MSLHERLAVRGGRRVRSALLRLLGVNLPPTVHRGRRLALPHGAVGLVVHERTRIGDDVRLYQGVTIGRSDVHLSPDQSKPGGRVCLGDRVVVGANAVILFRSGHEVVIGDDVVIGANAVVTRSIPAGQIWAGNPARRVGQNPRLPAAGADERATDPVERA
jgi:serine O-acetyltransferase